MATFIEQELQNRSDHSVDGPRIRRKTTWRTIFSSNLFKGVLAALFVAVTLPTIAYYIVISRHVTEEDITEQYYCLVQEEYRVPCGTTSISQKDCEQISCCFNTTTNQCHHFLPSKYYYITNSDGSYRPFQEKTPFGNKSVENIQIVIQEKGANKLSLVLHDSSETVEKINANTKNYQINQSTKKLIFEILDNDNDSIFSTAKGALIASEYYWEWGFQLSTDKLFGLDRNLISLSGNETLTKVIYKSKADHTTLPVFWAFQNGKFHGCVIKHDGPLEIEVLASNMIILRSLLGKKIEVELSLGPTPAELYKQQSDEIVVPPLWTLGTHNCRKGETLKLNEILKIYTENKDSTFDTDCLHQNLFMALQQTNITDEDLATFRNTLEEMTVSGTKFLLSLPPHILANESNPLYTTAKQQNILYKNQSGIMYNGTYLGQTVVYPDYTDQNIETFIQALMDWIGDKFSIQNISGFILNDNWPQDDSYNNVENTSFPYYSKEIDSQMQHTLPWNLLGSDSHMHLEKHNLYGSAQNKSLHSYLNGSTDLANLMIISATKTFGDTEPAVSDNFETSWDNFKMYLNKITFGSITGNYMIGLPVCGDTANYNKTLQETLCLRWYIAAATMPFFQVSSGDPFRDPINLNTGFATKAVNLAIERRKFLLEYFYTILSKKEPLVRPMYYDYYANTTTLNMERQYTIGSELIVAHPFSNGRIRLQVYLPPNKGNWYEFWGGTMFAPQKANGYTVDIDSLETDWIMFIAQGHIVALTDTNEIDLYIALDCSSRNSNCTATGEVYKDNTYITFTATNSSITVNDLPAECNYTLGFLKVYGYQDSTGYSERYEKNANLCNNSINTQTIKYTDK